MRGEALAGARVIKFWVTPRRRRRRRCVAFPKLPKQACLFTLSTLVLSSLALMIIAQYGEGIITDRAMLACCTSVRAASIIGRKESARATRRSHSTHFGPRARVQSETSKYLTAVPPLVLLLTRRRRRWLIKVHLIS